jgi:energy-coupling factor transporter ATP-binding protein EcfA2
VGPGEENLCLVGPAGAGKSHLLVALGIAAVEAGHRVRHFTASELVEALYRGMADNSVGRVIDTLLRADLVVVDELGFAPLDHTGAQLLFRFVAAAYERRSLGVGSHFPFEEWGRFLPEHTTAVSMLDRLLHYAVVVVTDGESYRMREARERGRVSDPHTLLRLPSSMCRRSPFQGLVVQKVRRVQSLSRSVSYPPARSNDCVMVRGVDDDRVSRSQHFLPWPSGACADGSLRVAVDTDR